ncbi:MAG: hypothetical protein H0Z24_09465 [Thermosipho sp. (in: Bacteria)]|nr:hypothetical protein [Thermosipho sp. (in: thermotogales)]
MRIRYRQYPHPVLSHFSDDIVGCMFETELDIDAAKSIYKFKACCRTDNKDFMDLIKDRKACFAFHIECAATRFRKIFTSFQEEFSFIISADELDGRVEICSFILATEDIADYRNNNFHHDYKGILFKVKKGDILAVDRDRIFFAEKEVDPLKKIPSIFTVAPNENQDAPPIDIDATNNRVVILLSKENFDRFKNLQLDQGLHSTLASLLVIPALISLLEMVKESVREGSTGVSEYEELRWFRVLVNKLKDIGIDIYNYNSFTDSTIKIAQELIGNPLTSSLKNLEGYIYED